ncbi:hypothetical protein TNCV_483341 [Trichonephila clavipes]|uniref:Uncharacterized protein n=1 Tax=Trichonephila clavipes TaxID=2585209 RepID=A0A8X6RCA0_TRICX|nr:hypothetical protein TNCV_483341 [Trichonephila clavipes]
MMGQKCLVTLKMHRQLYKEHLNLQKSFCALYRHMSEGKNAQVKSVTTNMWMMEWDGELSLDLCVCEAGQSQVQVGSELSVTHSDVCNLWGNSFRTLDPYREDLTKVNEDPLRRMRIVIWHL